MFKTKFYTMDNWRIVVLRKLERNILNAGKVSNIKDIRVIVFHTY